jgi:predicted ATPase
MANGTDDQERANAATYEDEVSSRRTVTIPLREYDKLREETHFIKDKSLISIIDKIEELVRAMIKMRIQDKGLNAVVDKTEELVRALRKHIVREDL